MKNSPFILDPSPRKYICPQCGKQRFVRYLHRSTGESVSESYGRCDRSNNCGYIKLPPLPIQTYFVSFDQIISYSEKAFKLTIEDATYYLPKSTVHEILENGCYVADFILDNQDAPPHNTALMKLFAQDGIINRAPTPVITPDNKLPSYIEESIMQKTLSQYSINNFANWLSTLFPDQVVQALCSSYNIGTSSDGATIFWQVDNQQLVRSGKIIKYLPDGHRDKSVKPACNWAHKRLNLKNFNLAQCLFGLHLLSDTPVCIVESEKTAVFCAALFPAYTWMSIGSKDAIFSDEKMSPLRNNKILLFPDIGAEQRWTEQALSLRNRGYDATVSDFLSKTLLTSLPLPALI
jgi:hypothetical protein